MFCLLASCPRHCADHAFGLSVKTIKSCTRNNSRRCLCCFCCCSFLCCLNSIQIAEKTVKSVSGFNKESGTKKRQILQRFCRFKTLYLLLHHVEKGMFFELAKASPLFGGPVIYIYICIHIKKYKVNNKLSPWLVLLFVCVASKSKEPVCSFNNLQNKVVKPMINHQG